MTLLTTKAFAPTLRLAAAEADVAVSRLGEKL